MELPVALQSLIQLGLGIVVTFLLTQLAKVGFDFSGYKSQIVASLFGVVMLVVNALLAKIPADVVGIAGAVLQLVVVVLGAFGLHGLYKPFRK